MPPVNRNTDRRVKNLLYSLKRQYGEPVSVYKLLGQFTDTRTGIKRHLKDEHYIPRAILLPTTAERHVEQSISAISANKQLVMGGQYDVAVRVFVIDFLDLRGFDLTTLTKDDWLVNRNKRYSIEKVQDFAPGGAWVVTARALEGERPEISHRVFAESLLRVTDGVDAS